jgi:hypothetical protein
MADPLDRTYDAIVRLVTADGTVACVKLQGEFVWAAGMEPGITPAAMLWEDFERIREKLEQDMKLEFWWSWSPGQNIEGAGPDVVHEKMRIVELAPLERGKLAQEADLPGGGPLRTTVYRVAISDFRDRWVWPRGGVLWKGEINKTPIDSATLFDANKKPLVNNERLIGMALEAMGYKVRYAGQGAAQPGEIVIPPNVNRTRPITDIHWRGDHAPTELGKLLAEVGAVLCPRRDGTIAINMLGVGNAVEVPENRKIPETDCPGIDRRGKTVIITSAPHAIIEQVKIEGMGAGKCEWVNRNTKGEWVPYGQCDAMLGKTAQQWISGDGVGVGAWAAAALEGSVPCSQDDIRSRVWACVKLDAEKYPIPILRDRRQPDKTVLPILVKAHRAVRDAATGTFSLRQLAPVDVAALLAGNVLVLREQLWRPGTYPAAPYYAGQVAMVGTLLGLHLQAVQDQLLADLLGELANVPSEQGPAVTFVDRVAWLIERICRKLVKDVTFAASMMNAVRFLQAELLQSGQATSEPRYGVEIDRDTFEITFSRELTAPDGSPVPFAAGFQMGVGGAITKLTEEATTTALANPTADVIIASHPELRLYRISDRFSTSDLNRQELEKAAEKLAPNYLKGSNLGPREVRVIGFASGGHLDGLLSEIRIGQEPPLTAFAFNTWMLPRGVYLSKRAKNGKQDKGSGGGSGGVPGGASQSERASSGAAGYSQPAVMVQTAPVYYPPSTVSEPEDHPCRLVVDGGANGTRTTACDWTYTVKSIGGATLATKVAYSGPRPSRGKFVEVEEKEGRYRIVNGNVVITWPNEVPERGLC